MIAASGGHAIPVRVYAPTERDGRLPGVLYIHGGGFALGSVDTEHAGAVLVARSTWVPWWSRWSTGWPSSTRSPPGWMTATTP